MKLRVFGVMRGGGRDECASQVWQERGNAAAELAIATWARTYG